MNITQTFYDNLASQYDKLFLDWQAATQEQALILDRIFTANGFDKNANIPDCACGIGTQAISLAAIGYNVTGSENEIHTKGQRNSAFPSAPHADPR